MKTLYLCPCNDTHADLSALTPIADENDVIVVLLTEATKNIRQIPDKVETYALPVNLQTSTDLDQADNKNMKTISYHQLIELTHSYSKIITWYL